MHSDGLRDGLMDSSTYAIGLISWAVNCHQAM